jgi:hypothetical protein
MNNKVTPLLDRYLAKVDKSGGPDACWPWTGSLNKGYGQIGAGPCPPGVARNSRVPLKAHHVAYRLEHGEVPAGSFVLHRCDNPPCCNPAHLFLGTQADNMHDMDGKGRRVTADRRGEAHGYAKLNDEIVRDIRALYAKGAISQTELGRLYGVTQAQISSIVLRKSWSHIT